MSSKPERALPTNLPLIPAKRRLDRTGRTLEAALELMADGKRWGTGQRRRPRRDGSYVVCALGAIDEVTTGPFAARRYRRAVARLADVIPGRGFGNPESTVFHWNDSRGGWNPVRQGFERAIAVSERRGLGRGRGSA